MTKEDPKALNADIGPDTDPERETDVESESGDGAEFQAEAEIGEGADADAEIGEGADTEAEAGTEAEEGTQAELDSVQVKLRRLRDQHLRLAADFENYRKRTSADLARVWVRAQAELVRSLVEGLDDLQRVSQFTCDDTTVDALIEGVDLVERNLLKGLTEAGLEVLDPEGERFDPNSMEAMMRVPTEEEGEDETVHQVFQKGYMFKDQLVRPARVSVYKDED